MTILFITHKFPPSIGGMQKQSYELINGVRKYTKVYTIIQSPTESKVVFFLKLRYRVKRMLRLHPAIEAIHCNDGLMACACIWIKKRYALPVTATFHGLDVVFPNLLFQKYLLPKLWALDKVFAVSSATREECLKRGFMKDQVIEICNGVSHESIRVGSYASFLKGMKIKHNLDLREKKIILSIGRSVKRKGFSWFAKRVMPHMHSDVCYLIVGPRSDSSRLTHKLLLLLPDHWRREIELFLGYPSDDEELDEVLGESKSGTFHLGVLPMEELKALMAFADLLVMPNIAVDGDMEGFGLVGLEANLQGTYVAAADIEGIRSAIINNRNGIMIASESSVEWARRLSRLLVEPNGLSQLGKRAKQYVHDNFSWDKMSSHYFKELERLTKKESLPVRNNYIKVA